MKGWASSEQSRGQAVGKPWAMGVWGVVAGGVWEAMGEWGRGGARRILMVESGWGREKGGIWY